MTIVTKLLTLFQDLRVLGNRTIFHQQARIGMLTLQNIYFIPQDALQDINCMKCTVLTKNCTMLCIDVRLIIATVGQRMDFISQKPNIARESQADQNLQN